MSPDSTNTQTSLAISIRTMGQDLAAIKKGQTPLPRVETVSAGPPEALPVEQLSRSPRPIPQPTPAPRPTVQPTPQKPAAAPNQLESVLAPKTPLPEPLIAPAQTAPKPPLPTTASHPPAPPKPALAPLIPPKPVASPAFSPPPSPSPPPPTAPQQTQPPAKKPAIPAVPVRPQPAIPQAPATGINRRKLILASSAVSVVILVAAGGAVWWFKFRPTPSPPPPLPIVEPTEPTPIVTSMTALKVEAGAPAGIPAAVTSAWATKGRGGAFDVAFVKIVMPDGTRRYATAADTIASYPLNIPAAISQDIADTNLIRFTQTEFLTPSTESLPPDRFAVAIKFTVAPSPETIAAWENTMAPDLEPYLKLSRFNAEPDVSNWKDSTHRGVAIRYINFALPDQSLDYAFLPAQNLLIVATSREGMYALIDLVLISNSQ